VTSVRDRTSSSPRIPARGIYTEEARLERLNFVRAQTGTRLDNLQDTSLAAGKLTGNIENLIGGVEVPVGLGGPLLFKGQKAAGLIYAPLATTEGALVASATRGATAITRSGGVHTRVIAQRMMRVPLFVLTDLEGAFLFASWIRDHTDEIRREVGAVSRHAMLFSVEPHVMGNLVHVTFLYETGDAAGQNMTTTCTWHACQWLMAQMKGFEEIEFENFLIEANMSGDKKVNYQSFIAGRGTRVVAECVLDSRVMEEVLKVTPGALCRTNRGIMTGSLQVGMIGYNINIANIIAAIFTATGQDIACIHESSLGQLHVEEVEGGGVHASMLLPSLIVGTVGGGTHLPRQRELLESMDCAGPGKVSRLAEVIAGFCLALDLSTLSAVASGQFAAAHERLGRNRQVDWFVREDLTPEFFTPGLREALGDDAATVVGAELIEGRPMGSSIITQLTARKVQKLVGLFPFRLDYESGRGGAGSTDVMVKVKPVDGEVMVMVNSMAGMCGPKLAKSYSTFKDRTGFKDCHVRELAVYGQRDQRFRRHMPGVYETYRDDEREAYVLVLELLDDMALMDTAGDVSGWSDVEITAAVRGAAAFHSVWYRREEELLAHGWLGHAPTMESMSRMRPLWENLAVHASEEFPEWFDQGDLTLHRNLVRHIPEWWSRLEGMPRTLIHNDFNPRNLCFRKTEDGPLLVAYDWELATLHVPQHDLAELLCFVLDESADKETLYHYVELHRRALEEETGMDIESSEWRSGFRYSLYDLAINRLLLYAMAHTFRHYDFMERVVRTARHLIYLEDDSANRWRARLMPVPEDSGRA